MLNEWMHWLTSKHIDELVFFLWAFLFFDSSRYFLLKAIVFVADLFSMLWNGAFHKGYSHCPSVSVLLAGYNESAGIESTLQSVWGTYPKLQIVVVDDGSTDGMGAIAQEFARNHPNVTVVRRENRGGKASAVNYGFKFATGEVILVMDTDASLDEHSIWELVQPFKRKKVGAVSGTLMPRNIFTNLITWFQAYEYLHSIFIGRLVSSKLGILGIVSGGYGAFRREVWLRCAGMDVGPPEDLDFTIRVRKAGYKVAFAPLSNCYTDVPDTVVGLVKQRFRWEQGGVVRNHCRKHFDLLNIFSANFRFSNLFLWLETFYFEFLSPYIIIAYFVWLMAYVTLEELFYISFTLYVLYSCLEILQILVCMFYSQRFWRDLAICAIFPFLFFYRTFLLFVRAIANTQELLFRVSYNDNYVPKHVRESTWHW